ncbi:MAG TPA: NHL repeat-containing protein [Gallionellaceae bacterium]
MNSARKWGISTVLLGIAAVVVVCSIAVVFYEYGKESGSGAALPQGAAAEPGASEIRGADAVALERARFHAPLGIAADDAGNVYVVDSGHNTMRKITPAGGVATLAGAGETDIFEEPHGIATDGAGNVYVSDFRDNTVRKITPEGEVILLAGASEVAGSDDGTETDANFNRPAGIAADRAGNVYVADSSNHTIRKITPEGAVTTLAGKAGVAGHADGTGAAATFRMPFGIAIDNAGNVYVADSFNHTIRRITPAGVVSTLAGTAGVEGHADGTGTAASFSSPGGLALDGANNLYVADSGNNTIRKITPAGMVTTVAGAAKESGYADGAAAGARFNTPHSIAIDRAGNLYVTDMDNNAIRKITPAGGVSTLAGNPDEQDEVQGDDYGPDEAPGDGPAPNADNAEPTEGEGE